MTFNFDLLISCGAIVAAIPIFSWSFVLFSQFKYHSQLKEEINLELFQETNRDDLEVYFQLTFLLLRLSIHLIMLLNSEFK